LNWLTTTTATVLLELFCMLRDTIPGCMQLEAKAQQDALGAQIASKTKGSCHLTIL
jgi:hypothetical protein